MTRHLSTSIVCGLAAVVTLGLAGTANAQSTDSTRASTSRARVTSSRRIPVRKDAANTTTTESAGAVAPTPTPNADSAAAAARQDSIANAERMRQDSIANAARMRQDSIASAERARQDSIANAERMRQDSIARADSIARWNLAHMRRPGTGLYFQVAAGPSYPKSDFDNGFDRGFDVTGSVGYHPMVSPVGIRFDVGYDRFNPTASITGTSDKLALWSGLADVTLRIPKMWAVSPYLLAGGGVAHFSSYGTSDSMTKGQWNAGGGIGFGLGNVKLFVESRYMHIATPNTATTYVPIVLGISL
jgi:hypothetical protein